MKVLKNESNYVEIEIDEDMGLLNILVDKIWKEPGVVSCSVVKRHPYMEKPLLIVEAKNPKSVILNALKKISKEITEFEKAF